MSNTIERDDQEDLAIIVGVTCGVFLLLVIIAFISTLVCLRRRVVIR